MTKTAKLNLTFLILAIFSIGGSYAYVLLTNGMELPIYADLLVAQLLILLPAWGYTKKEHINLYKEIRHRRLHFGALLCLVGITLLSMPLLSFLNLFSSLFVPNAAAGLAEQMTGGPGWMNILFLAVIPAFSEEFVFRGVFFHGYKLAVRLYRAQRQRQNDVFKSTARKIRVQRHHFRFGQL